MRVLVTNDDGIESPGVWALAARLAEEGHDPVIAAPAEDMSGASASIWRMHDDAHVDVVPVVGAQSQDLPAWSVAATPALIVLSAASGAFGAVPDLVAVGVNVGLNLGESILHSGTIGAALTAQRLGISAMAASLAPGDPWRWLTAAELAIQCVSMLISDPPGTVFNLNVPDGGEATPELRWAGIHPNGTVRAALAGERGDHLQLELRATDAPSATEFDTALVAAGYATLTSIAGVHECARPRPVAKRELARVQRAVQPVPALSVSERGDVRRVTPQADR
jgi:5'-nucleotidase